MMSTVWITLNTVATNEEQKTTTEWSETFMFGPTGIVRFKPVGEQTILITSNGVAVATVTHTQEEIMNILRKMRGTEGRMNGKKKQSRSSKKTSRSKTSSKSKKGSK